MKYKLIHLYRTLSPHKGKVLKRPTSPLNCASARFLTSSKERRIFMYNLVFNTSGILSLFVYRLLDKKTFGFH